MPAGQDVMAMSVKDLKAEISLLGGSPEGCIERKDLEKALMELREQHDRLSTNQSAAAGRQDQSENVRCPFATLAGSETYVFLPHKSCLKEDGC